jgi:hypothetical protein
LREGIKDEYRIKKINGKEKSSLLFSLKIKLVKNYDERGLIII